MGRTTLSDILTQQVTTFFEKTRLSYALDVMVSERLSSLIVIDDKGRPVAIFTERDSLKVIAGEST
jgi:predicted transcriptional regulator